MCWKNGKWSTQCLALCQECDGPYWDVAQTAWVVHCLHADTEDPTTPAISERRPGAACFMQCVQSTLILQESVYCHYEVAIYMLTMYTVIVSTPASLNTGDITVLVSLKSQLQQSMCCPVKAKESCLRRPRSCPRCVGGTCLDCRWSQL